MLQRDFIGYRITPNKSKLNLFGKLPNDAQKFIPTKCS